MPAEAWGSRGYGSSLVLIAAGAFGSSLWDSINLSLIKYPTWLYLRGLKLSAWVATIGNYA